MAHSDALLNNPAWHALTNQQAPIALGGDLARRFPPDVSPFGALVSSDAAAFASLAALIPSGEVVVLINTPPPAGETWTLLRQFPVLQMVYEGEEVTAEAAPAITPLSPTDVPAMLQLVEHTHPGPFQPRTIELGCYLAIWQDDGQLAAMAGERFHLPGYREISAVCTHPDFQRRGYARQLVQQLIRAIQDEGEVPILHVFPENWGAIALYESMGFRRRAELPLFVLKRE